MNLIDIIKEEIEKFVEEIDVTDIPDISLKTNAPQINRTGRFDTEVLNGKVKVLDTRFEPFKLYDYIIDTAGNLIVGGGHYKLSSKAGTIKAAGELKIDNNGKIIYINNESGHYEPSGTDLYSIAKKLKELNLTAPNLKVDQRY